MPGKISTQVGDKKFDSQNQAKKHYFGIMHLYEEGEKLKSEDREAVAELLKASAPEKFEKNQVKEVKAARGRYGKKCLQTSMDGAYFAPLSIVTAIKQCAPPMLVNHGLI